MDGTDDSLTDDDKAAAKLLDIVLIAHAVNETRKDSVLASLGGIEVLSLCRPLIVKLRALCDAALDGGGVIN